MHHNKGISIMGFIVLVALTILIVAALYTIVFGRPPHFMDGIIPKNLFQVPSWVNKTPAKSATTTSPVIVTAASSTTATTSVATSTKATTPTKAPATPAKKP